MVAVVANDWVGRLESNQMQSVERPGRAGGRPYAWTRGMLWHLLPPSSRVGAAGRAPGPRIESKVAQPIRLFFAQRTIESRFRVNFCRHIYV